MTPIEITLLATRALIDLKPLTWVAIVVLTIVGITLSTSLTGSFVTALIFTICFVVGGVMSGAAIIRLGRRCCHMR